MPSFAWGIADIEGSVVSGHSIEFDPFAEMERRYHLATERETLQ
jgi:hypothetical protein